MARGDGWVGEYTTSGATINAFLLGGFDYPEGIAVSGSHLFVADGGNAYTPGVIGEYTTSGATMNASLIPGLAGSIAISGSNMFVGNENGIGDTQHRVQR